MGSKLSRFLKKVAKPVAVIAAIVYPPLIPAIGTALGASGVAATVVGAAALSTGASLASGDSIEDALKSGAISGLTAGVASFVPNLSAGVADALGGGPAASIAADALIGGTMAEIRGGDFAEGALLSGIGSGINQAKLAAASDYLDSLPGGQGVYSDAPPDMSDFDLPPAVIDTTFTPDYSLSTGALVVPDMGAQGIQVPTINEVVDVVGSPVDYSLPIPVGDGIGLQMPTVPNLDAMGGGQGITVPVAGGTLTEAGVIPPNYSFDLGDPASFINQPAPDVSVNIAELPEATPKDIDTELGLLNAAKNLAPVVVGSLLADKVINQDDQQTGFDIVPIPSDWRSPEYNQTFTPSAAIDFGNVGMLAGTQFQPMDVSSLINTLNQQPQFNQVVGNINDVPMSINDIIGNLGQPMQPFDMNNIIGEIDGTPMSLNSIIAGIQSQYG